MQTRAHVERVEVDAGELDQLISIARSRNALFKGEPA